MPLVIAEDEMVAAISEEHCRRQFPMKIVAAISEEPCRQQLPMKMVAAISEEHWP